MKRIKSSISNLSKYKISSKKDDYLHFLEKLKNPCLQKMYIKLYLTKKDFNVYLKNKLFLFYQQIMNEKNIYYLTSLFYLLSYFVSFHKIPAVLDRIKNTKTDKEVIEWIDRINEKDKKRDSQHFPLLCNRYEFCFEMIKEKIGNKLKKCEHYLDVCCGDGKKTILFGKVMGAKKVYGTDISLWGPYSNQKKFSFDFQLIKKDGTLDYEDGQMDVITCFLSLHHIEKVETMIENIYQKLRKGGVFVVIEHDILNEMDNYIVDIEHMFYGYFYDKNKDYLDHPLYARYLNRMEWIWNIQKAGFKMIGMDNVVENVSMTKRYDNQVYLIFSK